MLGVDIDKAHAQLAQGAQLHGHIVHEGSALSRRGDDTTDNRLRLVVQIILLKQRLQPIAIDVECALDNAVAALVADGSALVLIAEQQAQRSEQNRLTRTRLSCDDIEVGVELKIEFVDQGVVLYRESSQHLIVVFRFYQQCGQQHRASTSGATPRHPRRR